jgi:hypothetical protein
MTTYRLTRDDLEDHFREQVAFLDRSVQAFDSGYEDEAKRLATVIRVLLHDTPKSASVLAQLGVKESIRYLDTAEPINPRNLVSTPGLVIMRMTSGVGGSYVAPLDDRPPVFQPQARDFRRWWETPVTKDATGTQFSRKDYVLGLSNKEGGAHVDPTLDAEYAALSRSNSLGWMYVPGDESSELPFANNPALPSVRQISHELLLGLRGQLTPLIDPAVDPAGVELRPAFLQGVERNGPCPCGSGRKAKKCHLR